MYLKLINTTLECGMYKGFFIFFRSISYKNTVGPSTIYVIIPDRQVIEKHVIIISKVSKGAKIILTLFLYFPYCPIGA